MSASIVRLSTGGTAIDRDRPLNFHFNGRTFKGYRGDTLASALLANDVRAIGRSFKFHRPRGIFSSGFEEPNSFVQVGTGAHSIPSMRSTLVELHEGLQAFVRSGWPSLNFDCGRLLDLIPSLWAAGFYNKTFIWPAWHAYEGLVRRLAGFGHLPSGPDPDRYDVHNVHCDVLVIGGGVSGLNAAQRAAEQGARVLIAELRPELGGTALWDGTFVDGVAARLWIEAASGELERTRDVKILTRTFAAGYYERDVVTLVQSLPFDDVLRGAPRERLFIVRASRVISAAGAIEQPLIFCNNDRPGVLLAGAVRSYLRQHAVLLGRRVLIATNNDTAYGLVHDLKLAGAQVVAVADTRTELDPALTEQMRALSVPLLSGTIPIDTRGFTQLKSVELGHLTRDQRGVEARQHYACDCLAVSGGWNPAMHLYSQARGRLSYDSASGTLAPTEPQSMATYAATGPVGIRISPVGDSQRQWVDLRHDVTVADLELAVRENLSSIEHVKRYTTLGMAADQGKTSYLAGIDLIARLRGLEPAHIGHTTLRPPFMPMTLGVIAGRQLGARFAPMRRLPMHDWHVAHGGVLEDYGDWRRPSVYIRPGESREAAVMRESRAVRGYAGLLDSSSLGKIEVQGPDTLEFVDRFYINNLRALQPGRVRYGLMLKESGVLFDDGTVTLLAMDHALITTTSSNAARVDAWLEEWRQCEWPMSRVAITSVTEQWSTMSLAGPRARDVLSRLQGDIDLSNAAFPHLGMRQGNLLGYPARIYRVSFTGELTYEINVPAGVGQIIWDALLIAGATFGIEPFGLDAQALMRMEKGFLHIGTDTDGTSVPDDVGWGAVAAGKVADFVGKRSLQLPENQRADRFQLIGLRSETVLRVGSHLRLPASEEATDGWVTSAGRAVITGEPIALAVLRSGRAKVGSQVTAHDEGSVTFARVVNPPFYDSTGERMRA